MKTASTKDYWESRLSNQFDLQGVGFIGLGKHYNAWLYKVRRNVFLRKMKATLLNFRSVDVLDIGSGTGFYIERWRELAVRNLVGVDLTQTAVDNLKQKYPEHEFYQVDIGGDTRTLANRRFDVISAFDVLFHIIDDQQYQKAIENIYSLLKPGGLFVLSENFLHTETIVSKHQVCRQLDTIEHFLTGCGFEILDRSPMFCLMNAPVDTNNVFLKAFWRFTSKIISRSELAGLVIGGFLYPLELFLALSLSESPTTEIMVCKKPA